MGLQKKKILFKIEQDDDGYPPTSVEGIWCLSLNNGNYLIDNIPFFVYGLASGDEILIEKIENEFFFNSLVKPSYNSVFRISPKKEIKVEKIRKDLTLLNCKTEYDKLFKLIALEVEKENEILPVLDYLVRAQEHGDLDFEEAVLHHKLH